MKHLHRIIVGTMAGLLIAVVLGGAATPAYAAGTVIYVDDTPTNNGTVSCKPTSIQTLAGGIAAIGPEKTNVTLTICPGEYNATGPMTFNGFTNLKIIGKGSPVINAPVNFSGSFLYFVDSRKVTVQGLIINGKGHLSSVSYSSAIEYLSTSGTITGNTVRAWHQSYGAPPPIAVGAPVYAIVDQSLTFAANVTITKNTIYDSQDAGIWVSEPGKAKVTKNRIVFSSAITPAVSVGDGSIRVQGGIIVAHSAPGTLVSGNQIRSDADLYPSSLASRGIMIYETSGTKVTSNTVWGTARQISIESYCDESAFPNANANIVSGNKLYDTFFTGVSVIAQKEGIGCTTPHADLNKITGNKVYTEGSFTYLPYGVYLHKFGVGVVDHNVVKGNTLGGFTDGEEVVNDGDANATLGPNKLLLAPPAGALP